MESPVQRMERVLREEVAYDAFDIDMTPEPQALHDAVRALATVDAVPFLAETIEKNMPGKKWAVVALGLLGPAAAAAAPALEEAGEWVALFRVDEARARKRDAHLRKNPSSEPSGASVRSAISDLVASRGPWEARAHFADLLGVDDDELLLFALDANPRDGSRLRRLAAVEPASVPIAEVRALLSHGNDAVATAAARLMADLHLPSDAQKVLDVIGGRGLAVACAEWLGPMRDSEILYQRASASELVNLVRRRRCAGLQVDVGEILTRLGELVAPRSVTGVNARTAAELELTAAAQLAGVLRDPGGAGALLTLIGPREDGLEAGFEDLVAAFVAIGDVSTRVLAGAHGRTTGERAELIGFVIDGVTKARARLSPVTLAIADKYFADGVLEDGGLHKSAYSAYAQVLAREPRNAHAAFQLAWIDRGFGTPIAHERIAWLRELGVAQPLLDDLGRRPSQILHGSRPSHRHVREVDATRALEADQAGLFSIAAQYYGPRSREGARCIDQTRNHLARVRGGVR